MSSTNHNCVFCCLHARLIPDPTQHTLDNEYLLYFRGDALFNQERINHDGNPNIITHHPIEFYIDVVWESRSGPGAQWVEILHATYVRGLIRRTGDAQYHEENDKGPSSRENQIEVINHALVEEELGQMIRTRPLTPEELERYGWVQIRREDERWFDLHYELFGDEMAWRGEREPSRVVCDLHRDYRFWLVLIGPLMTHNVTTRNDWVWDLDTLAEIDTRGTQAGFIRD